MPHRPILRSLIEKAWRQTIEEDYATQWLNSERALQAALWSRLKPPLNELGRKIFIEPGIRVRVGDGHKKEVLQSRLPDFMICNSRQVIGVIEIKFQPRTQPRWNKDLETFRWMVEHRRKFKITNFRYLGIRKKVKEYELAEDALFVWAGVHLKFEANAADHIAGPLRNQFLELHAETAAKAHPVIR